MKKMVYLDGGAGRVLCAVPAIEQLSKMFDVEVITAYPGIFRHNPNVKKVHDILPDENGQDGITRLWNEIKLHDFQHPEPYHNYTFYQDIRHLIECFGDELKVTIQNRIPSLYLAPEEKIRGLEYVNSLRQQYGYKKVICFQPFGSSGIGEKDSTNRSLPTSVADTLFRRLNAKGIGVVYIGKEPTNDPALHTKKFTLRDIFSIVYASDGILAVDSLIQHVAYAFDKPGVVCWGSTSSKVLGYDTMINIYKKDFILKEPWQARFPSNSPDNKGCMNYDEETINKVVDAVEAL